MQVVVEGNGLNNVTVSTSSPSLLLTNLTAGVTYSVRTAASTKAGVGPFSSAASLRLDPASRVLLTDHHLRYVVLLPFIVSFSVDVRGDCLLYF